MQYIKLLNQYYVCNQLIVSLHVMEAVDNEERELFMKYLKSQFCEFLVHMRGIQLCLYSSVHKKEFKPRINDL